MKDKTRYIIVGFLIIVAVALFISIFTQKTLCVTEYVDNPVRLDNGDVIYEREIITNKEECYSLIEMFSKKKELDKKSEKRVFDSNYHSINASGLTSS